jgi:hypothetical protein
MNFMFNLSDYQTCAERLELYWKENPDGRIDTELLEAVGNRFIVKASVYRTEVDAHAWATGLAFETISDRGVNSTSALENAETSAIARALANCGYSPKGDNAKRASREEMTKVQNNQPKTFKEKLEEKITVEVEDDPWTVKAVKPAPHASMSVDDVAKAIGATVMSDDPTCKHGNRVWATGTSKAGKVWGHWKCNASPMNGQRWADVDKCDPIWCDLSPKGTWSIRVEK